MTLQECAGEHLYDVTIWYDYEDEGWRWEINGGYCAVNAHNLHKNPQDAYVELIEYLKTFKPFEK